MKLRIAIAWLAVIVAVVLAIFLRISVEPSDWLLVVMVSLACLPIGYLLGGSDDSAAEPPSEDRTVTGETTGH
jgi:hypothetical protein